MNYIASYGIVSLYPEWTMRRSGLLIGGDASLEISEKYRRRGFKMANSSSELTKYDDNHECGKQICCLTMKRSLDDGFSLFISFEEVVTQIRDVEHEGKTNFLWMLKGAEECRKKS